LKPVLHAVAILAFGKLLFAVQDVIIKEMSGGYPVHQIVSIRGLVAIPLLLTFIHYSRGLAILRNHRPGQHLVRGALMFLAFMAFYIALSEISLTTATALFFTAPFFITLLSVPLLNEQVGIRRIASISVGFIGVLVVLRPESESFKLTALLPIIAAFFYACCQLMVRVAKMTAPPSVMSLYASISFLTLGCLSGLILAGVEPVTGDDASSRFLLRPWSIPDSFDFVLLSLTGLTSALGFMMSSNAYQLEQASKVAPFEYVMIIWVTLLSYLVWNEIPDAQTMAGIALIAGSGIYVLKREQKIEPKPIAYSGLTRR
jgi:S-adenosylmethionine uptake transporter